MRAWLVPGALAVVALLDGSRAEPQGTPAAAPPALRTARDQEALRGFEFYLGTWVSPGAPPEHGLEFAWGVEEKSLHMRELPRVGEELQVQSDALVGWHYGEHALIYHEFVRDSRPAECMNVGRVRFEPENVLVREFTSFAPDGTSLAWRETFTPDGLDAAWQRIEYRDVDASWKPWGSFRLLRR